VLRPVFLGCYFTAAVHYTRRLWRVDKHCGSCRHDISFMVYYGGSAKLGALLEATSYHVCSPSTFSWPSRTSVLTKVTCVMQAEQGAHPPPGCNHTIVQLDRLLVANYHHGNPRRESFLARIYQSPRTAFHMLIRARSKHPQQSLVSTSHISLSLSLSQNPVLTALKISPAHTASGTASKPPSSSSKKPRYQRSTFTKRSTSSATPTFSSNLSTRVAKHRVTSASYSGSSYTPISSSSCSTSRS